MKLVIDIPENGYQTLVKMKKSQGSLGYYHEIILNGVPISEDSADIKKIRAEIAELEDGIWSYTNDRPWIFKDQALAVIDKYIKE